MAGLADSELSQALAIRLNMQISLSSMPVVEEWMDIHLTRFLEHVPLPPEMPRGHSANFLVKIASDLTRLTWSAYGNPAGFIPKMAKYFELCKMGAADTALLDVLGNSLEPELFGGWVSVREGEVATGWQFCDPHPFSSIVDAFGDHPAKARLVGWVETEGLDKFQQFTQKIADPPYSEIEFLVPGVAIDDQVESLSRAFATFTGEGLKTDVMDALNTALEPRFAVSVRIEDGMISRVAALAPAVSNDTVAALCRDISVRFDDNVVKLQGALRSDGSERIEYAREGETETVDLHIVPTGTATRPGDSPN